MRQERGLSFRTIESRCWWLGKFLARLGEAGFRLTTVRVVQVDDILIRMIQDDGYKRVTVQGLASVLRVFFRYAEDQRLCRRGLSGAITSPRVYRHETLPSGPSWSDVKKVVAATRGDKPAEVRDHAILMLLAVYALRRGDLVALRLEDFDREGITSVRSSKTAAIADISLVSSGRQCGSPLFTKRPSYVRPAEMFLTRAPFRPLGCLRCFARGSPTATHRWSQLAPLRAHALRHSCATHLLTQGLSLKEIGDHLGHCSPEATRIYAKVDVVGLRKVGDFDVEGLL